MSLWEFSALVKGYADANSSDEEQPPAMNDDAFDEMLQELT